MRRERRPHRDWQAVGVALDDRHRDAARRHVQRVALGDRGRGRGRANVVADQRLLAVPARDVLGTDDAARLGVAGVDMLVRVQRERSRMTRMMARVVRMHVFGAVELVAEVVAVVRTVQVRMLGRRADRRGVPERDVGGRRGRGGLDADGRILVVMMIVPRLLALRLHGTGRLPLVMMTRHVDADAQTPQDLAREVVVGRMLPQVVRVGVWTEVGADDCDFSLGCEGTTYSGYSSAACTWAGGTDRSGLVT